MSVLRVLYPSIRSESLSPTHIGQSWLAFNRDLVEDREILGPEGE